MSQATRLTKAQVNAYYYNAVGGEILFPTEAQSNVYPTAIARLVAAQAARLGKRTIRIMEIGASNCVFAGVFLPLFEDLVDNGEALLDQVDYFAVEYAESALEAAIARSEEDGSYEQVSRFPRRVGPGEMALLGRLTNEGALRCNVYLLHSEANQCVQNSTGSFDFVILNELLDDMPYRAFYADAAGVKHELTAHAAPDGPEWLVTVGVEAPPADIGLGDLPPGTLTATSAESLRLVRGISSLLASGGMLLIHDYGFADPYVSVSQYESLPRANPAFTRIEFPAGSDSGFPRSFFRVFGNEAVGAVQITNDVNFAELAAALEPTGMVITLPHGNSLWARNPSLEALKKGDGVFLSEFQHLGLDDDLAGQLLELEALQASLRERYRNEYSNGVAAVFNDLIYIKR